MPSPHFCRQTDKSGVDVRANHGRKAPTGSLGCASIIGANPASRKAVRKPRRSAAYRLKSLDADDASYASRPGRLQRCFAGRFNMAHTPNRRLRYVDNPNEKSLACQESLDEYLAKRRASGERSHPSAVDGRGPPPGGSDQSRDRSPDGRILDSKVACLAEQARTPETLERVHLDQMNAGRFANALRIGSGLCFGATILAVPAAITFTRSRDGLTLAICLIVLILALPALLMFTLSLAIRAWRIK